MNFKRTQWNDLSVKKNMYREITCEFKKKSCPMCITDYITIFYLFRCCFLTMLLQNMRAQVFRAMKSSLTNRTREIRRHDLTNFFRVGSLAGGGPFETNHPLV